MANNWAIAIGINQYQFFQPLGCAQADAEALKDFLVVEAGFLQQQCLLMTDTSPPLGDRSTYPSKENILLLIEDLAAACWQPEDRLWFFFSGCGIHYNGQDYLMPAEGNPERVEETGIEVRALIQNLLVAELDVVLLLDINRAFATQANTLIGQEIIEIAQQLDIATIISCQPEQFSHESNELGHGFFTAALLEALRCGHGNNLADLERYLSLRTPELCQHYWRPTQNPITVIPSKEQAILPTLEVNEEIEEDIPIITSREILAAALPAPSLHPNPQINSSPWQLGTDPHPSTQQVEENRETQKPNLSKSSPPPTPPLASSTKKYPKKKKVAKISSSKPLMWWGGSTMVALGLVTAVFLRNQASFKAVEMSSHSSQIANDDSETEILPVSPHTDNHTQVLNTSPGNFAAAKINQSSPTVTVDPQLQKRNQALLDSAKKTIRQTQASDLSIAIATARKIKPGEPLYEQAQENIQIWSRMIFNLAEGRAKQRQYANAIAAAELINQDQALYQQAQIAINQWRVEARQYMANKTLLDAASGLIQPRQASTYNRAIEVAKKVAPDEPGFEQAQISINQWSEKILDLAKQRASRGQFKTAIATATLIPEGTSAYKKAQQALQKWQNSGTRD